MAGKEELLKALIDDGQRESALLLKNWNEMDSVALEKAEKLSKPAPEGVSEEKYDRCVEQVKEEGDAKNAYAVCASSLKGDTEKTDYNGSLPGGSENHVPTMKDDKPHPPGSPEDQAHDVIELDQSLQDEMKDLSPEGKSAMLEHLRNYKKDPQGWKRSKKNIKAGDEKDEPGRD